MEGDDYSCKLLLAKFIRQRRQQLGISVERAAELTGIVALQWAAIEAGWVPDPGSNYLYSIAGALEVNTRSLVRLADISRTKAA
jgi:transcriptional regulator with XRE-family HTH domain